jgi:hypothetical protein
VSVILYVTTFNTLCTFNFDSNYLHCTMHLLHEKKKNCNDQNLTCAIETIAGGPKI